MNWYLAKLVYRIICGDGNHTPQFDEQLRLIFASGKNEAFLKASEIGNAEEETLFNNKQQLVEWKFINVAELYRVDEWNHGVELYSRINETEDAERYIALTNQKAKDILQDETFDILKLT